MSVDGIDFGPLEGLIGVWKGEKGMDRSPSPNDATESPFFETLKVEVVGDVENAKSQTLAILRYHQEVFRKSNNQKFHDETGYWMWDAEQNIVMHSLVIPRGVAVLAGGEYQAQSGGEDICLKVKATQDDPNWSIVQSPFMDKNAKTVEFRHELKISGNNLSYKETTVLDIYGKTFDHNDENTLHRQPDGVEDTVEVKKQVEEKVDASGPQIADTKPTKVSLKKGESYAWCSCGKSSNQPYCDGSHRGTSYKPKMVSVEEDQEAWLCLCKHTKNPPYCDGTHSNLPKQKNSNESTSSTNTNATNSPEEPTLNQIQELAKHGLTQVGHHGEMDAMGVPAPTLPKWDSIQILTGQFSNKPLMEDIEVGTNLVIGSNAKKPLELKIPLFVSDMSYGALSEEAKIALAKGAELAGTGICSGEGGMLPEEKNANSRYFYELASAMFGYNEEQLKGVQAFHFKGGQGAKTGTGGHLPGDKVKGKVAEVRNLKEGQSAISPPTFKDMSSPKDFLHFSDRVREVSGGIPIGMKLSANHIEKDIEFALQSGVDYLILDGRGGGTGAAPLLFRNHISVPTIPALGRARRYLDKQGRSDVTLIVTGGLRVPSDFIKAMALGADGIALSNAAIQAIGCVAARMCHTNNCPAGVATQKPELRAKLKVEEGAQQLAQFMTSSVSLMQVMARACGHHHLNQFNISDLTTWDKAMSELSGIPFGGHSEL